MTFQHPKILPELMVNKSFLIKNSNRVDLLGFLSLSLLYVSDSMHFEYFKHLFFYYRDTMQYIVRSRALVRRISFATLSMFNNHTTNPGNSYPTTFIASFRNTRFVLDEMTTKNCIVRDRRWVLEDETIFRGKLNCFDILFELEKNCNTFFKGT